MKGRTGAKAVGSFVPALTRKAFEKYGFASAVILTDWRQIVGERLATYTAPERLKWPRTTGSRDDWVGTAGETDGPKRGPAAATLVLRVEGARALEVEYARAQIIERINAHFGYRAVADIRIVQAPPGGRTGDREPRHAGQAPAASRAGDKSRHEPPQAQPPMPPLEGIDSEPLKAALARLGASITKARR